MRFRNIAAATVIAALTGLGSAAVVTATPGAAPPAQARVTLYGLCSWDASYNVCARQDTAEGAFRSWPRDISGDANQQVGRSYQGQVSSANCWPFNCGSGNNSYYNGAAVYKIFNTHSGLCLAASSTIVFLVYAQSCSANGTNWVWDGNMSKASLVNVYQTNHRGNTSEDLTRNALYNPLSTQANLDTWGMIAVIG